jgi:hypothetical protein
MRTPTRSPSMGLLFVTPFSMRRPTEWCELFLLALGDHVSGHPRLDAHGLHGEVLASQHSLRRAGQCCPGMPASPGWPLRFIFSATGSGFVALQGTIRVEVPIMWEVGTREVATGGRLKGYSGSELLHLNCVTTLRNQRSFT